MNLPLVLTLVALSVVDPSGDAFGDGTLTAPTAPLYANTAVFDLHEVTLAPVTPSPDGAAPGGTRLAVTLGSLGHPSLEATGEEPASAATGAPARPEEGDMVNGAEEAPLDTFLPAVVDVYLVEGAGGADRTLPGPDLLFPTGTGWRFAVRLTSGGAFFVEYPALPEGEADPEPVDLDELPRVPLTVFTHLNSLVVYLPFTLAEDVRIQAMTGVYDPFSPTGWRPLARAASPWQFSTVSDQAGPVVDLLATSAEAQRQALATGILPSVASSPTLLTVPWLWLMAAGLALAAFGLVMRARVRVPEEAPVAPVETGEPVPEPEPITAPEGAALAEEPLAAADADEQPTLVATLEDDGGAAAAMTGEPASGETPAGEAGPATVPDEESTVPTESGAGPAPAELVPIEHDGDAGGGAPAEPRGEAGPEAVEGSSAGAGSGTPAEPAADPEEPAEAPALESYLIDLDDPRLLSEFLGDDGTDTESFWYPRARRAQARASEEGAGADALPGPGVGEPGGALSDEAEGAPRAADE